MDARDEEQKKKEKETFDTHTTIEKELYICALTNLPRTTYTLWRRVKHILFFISPLFSFAFFLQRMSLRVGGCSAPFVNKQISRHSFISYSLFIHNNSDDLISISHILLYHCVSMFFPLFDNESGEIPLKHKKKNERNKKSTNILCLFASFFLYLFFFLR
jgi:hypothetical protein